MALTKEDLRQIRGVVDESIANHPRFEELKIDLVEVIEAVRHEIVTDVCDVTLVGFTIVGERFDLVDERFDVIEKRLDNLKIVSNI